MKHNSFLFLAEGFGRNRGLDCSRRNAPCWHGHKDCIHNQFKKVRGAHGISVTADLTFNEADYSDTEWLICAGRDAEDTPTI